ncbi:MAG: undecaprenyl-diphosphate phosphatase [Bacteroidetes bacterium]|nr:undecaprenyl-diphosphate phosphatase [Bacteroidota bacterium]
MDLIEAFILGILQGITEFLPISSSGHLALGKILLGSEVESGITYEVVVHFGTLVSIMYYYRTELSRLFSSGVRFLLNPAKEKESADVHFLGMILISMIPAFIVGFTLKDQVEAIFSNPLLVSLMLLVTGFLLFSTKFIPNRIQENGTSHVAAAGGGAPIGIAKSFAIGLAQACAMTPGISRSGSTITMALWLGVDRETAANFSFIMVIPVIGGAMLLQVLDLLEVGIQGAALQVLVVGFLSSAISGYFALKYLIIILKKSGFYLFSFYCWAVGLVGVWLFM